jgi:hypothetical protein
MHVCGRNFRRVMLAQSVCPRRPGVNVMVNIWADFRQFSEKKNIGVFLENKCCDPNFCKN